MKSTMRISGRGNSPLRVVGPAFRPDTAIERLARGAITGARAGFRRFVASLHETRRQQAALELERCRHLICEPDASILLFEKYVAVRKRK